MQIDWTTFGLEILNFLVLMWILQHFFYRPVRKVLDDRRASVQAQIDEAASVQKEALALKAQYEARNADWATERDQLRHALNDELDQARQTRLAELQGSLAKDAEARKARDLAASVTAQAAIRQEERSFAFADASAMLQRLASPDLTLLILRAFEDDLASLPAEQVEALRAAAAKLGREDKVDVATAHALIPEMQASLTVAISKAVGAIVTPVYRVMPDLIAGMRIGFGEYLLSLDLADELAWFEKETARG